MPYYRRYQPSYGPGSSMTDAVKTLLIVNVAVFLGSSLVRWFPWGLFAMTPQLVFSKLMIWQLFTYMFLHADVMHVAINMLMLWFFGPRIEQALGSKKFLFYYFFTGIGAALCSFVFSFNSSILGASGAIFGLLVAYAMMFPETVVLVFFFFPMKIKYAVLFFAAVNLLGAISSSGGIAYFAHLGGALFGYLYFKKERLKFWLLGLGVSRLKSPTKKRTSRQKRSSRDNIDKRVDAILDKISKSGLSSLTEEERRILEEKSKNNR